MKQITNTDIISALTMLNAKATATIILHYENGYIRLETDTIENLRKLYENVAIHECMRVFDVILEDVDTLIATIEIHCDISEEHWTAST